MKVSDSIIFVNPNSPASATPGTFFLDSIILRPLLNKSHRHFYLHALDTVASAGVKNTVWVEGIGSLCLINTPGQPPNIMGISQLSCFFNGGVKEYEKLDSISSCQSIYPLSGIEENIKFKNSIVISPNPSNEILKIKARDYDFENQKIEIINLLGKTELVLDYHYSINISPLSSGLYFLRFVRENHIYVLKFVKD